MNPIRHVVRISCVRFWSESIFSNFKTEVVSHYLSVKIERTTAYSMIALKMLKMQVTMKLSIAFKLLEAAAGALALKVIKGLKFYLK